MKKKRSFAGLFLVHWMLISFVLIQGCGDETDPDAVSAVELKPPGNLKIKDHGNGSISLIWNTANPEKAFEGYNIYGAKLDALPSGAKEGEPIQLLDQAGEPLASAKTILAAFSYDQSNAAVLDSNAGEAIAVDASDDAPKFAALPLHVRNAANKPLLPTCRPSVGAEQCQPRLLEDEVDASTISSLGRKFFNIDGLKVGSQYCFTVFSVQDEGAEVSQSSSNIACVIPRFKIANNTITVASSGTVSYYLKLRTIVSDCAAATGCVNPLSLSSPDASQDIQASNTTTALAIESYAGDAKSVFLSTGKNATIKALGYAANGFSDDLLPIPELTFQTTGAAKAPGHGGGYSQEAQSILLSPGQIYVIAVGDVNAATVDDFKGSNYAYHLLWVHASSGVSRGDQIGFDLMLAAHKGTK